jgi:gliding motility-associated-like protein
MRNYFILLFFGLSCNSVAQHMLFSANDYNLAFLSAEGFVYITGSNGYGQLGIGPSANVSTPVRVKNLGGLGYLPSCKQISLEGFASCLALSHSGDSVFAWGKNDNGELGNGNFTHQNLPVLVKDPTGTGILHDVKQICTGGYTSYALLENGMVVSWGQNTYGELGCNNPLVAESALPVYVLKGNGDTLRNVKMLVSGGSFAMALLCDGTVWAWGRNHRGQLGQNNQTNSFSAIQVKRTTTTFLTNVTKIENGDNYSYALANDTLFSWGNNAEGQLGSGNFVNRRLPAVVQASAGNALLGVRDVAAGQGAVMVLLNDGTLRSWGNNDFGQLGINDSTIKKSTFPRTVVSSNGSGVLSNINYIVSGDRFCFARTNSGLLYSWGENTSGQLGVGDFLNRHFPTAINVGFAPTELNLPHKGNLVGPEKLCKGLNSGTINLMFNSWSIKEWKVSEDNFNSHQRYVDPVNFFPYLNIQSPTSYKAITQECGVLDSTFIHSVLLDFMTRPGEISSESRVVEKGRNNDLMYLRDNLGAIKFWQNSKDNFVRDSVLIPSIASSISFTNLDTSHFYRAAVKSGTCPLRYTEAFQIHVIGEEGIKIYNGFTPNGDAYNDEWIIDSLQYFQENLVEVFDRQGDLVFKASGYNNRETVWKGEHQQKGEELPDGTYFYRISPGPVYKTRTGFVVISR